MELGRAVGVTLAKVKQSIKGQHGSYCVCHTSCLESDQRRGQRSRPNDAILEVQKGGGLDIQIAL
jgi:hypothetical protein